MAVTKMMHMKECEKYAPQHLINAVRYVLDEKELGRKTEYGKWVGGNAGLNSEEIISAFLDTKSFWGKEDGRQGYHFVLSFGEAEEVDAETCYAILSEFCEKYLGDSYDYMFAVHTDKKHMHGHIIFNSVNRETGLKYRYLKGDWERYIQPVTDEICRNRGLKELTYEKERVGVSYASWKEAKKTDLTWSQVMRADVDYAIEHSGNWEEFCSIMAQFHYKMHFGSSRQRSAPYIAFRFMGDDGKGKDGTGKPIATCRSYSLCGGWGSGAVDEYTPEKIRMKIENKALLTEPYYEEVSGMLQTKVSSALGASAAVLHGTKSFQRMYQAVSFYRLPNPFAVPARQVRMDMLRIEKLIEECAYLKKQPSVSEENLKSRASELDARLKNLYMERRTLRKIEEDMKTRVPAEVLTRYRQLLSMLSEAGEYGKAAEDAQDEMEEIEKCIPPAFIKNAQRLHRIEQNIRLLKKENRVLGRILETEEGGELKALKKEPVAAVSRKI